jgi:hypothetical protein
MGYDYIQQDPMLLSIGHGVPPNRKFDIFLNYEIFM